MAKKRCAQFRFDSLKNSGVLFLAASLLGSCTTPFTQKSRDPESVKAERITAADALPEALTIHGEIFPKEVEAGSIAVVQLKLPASFRAQAEQGNLSGDFEGITLPFFSVATPNGPEFESIVSVPYERKPGPAKVTFGKLEIPFTVIDGNYSSESLRVDGSRVQPTRSKILKRIMKERAEVGKLYKRVTNQKAWTGPFVFPLNAHKVTSAFGTKRVYNGRLKNFHTGLDLKAPQGTPVYSAAPGTVVLAKNLFYTGNTVIVDHGYGVMTLYAHMSRLKVKKDQPIKTRQLLGLSGKTGRVNGPHLHWQAVVHQVKVNPTALTKLLR